ncbi:hypothetical protein B4155_0146 [Bacillus cereus]|nr:hypothetical protein B4155_0146 [Bacillus cereus]
MSLYEKKSFDTMVSGLFFSRAKEALVKCLKKSKRLFEVVPYIFNLM